VRIELGMQIRLIVDGAGVGMIQGLTQLADAFSRLGPGHAIALESDGTERFLADRIQSLAKRRHYDVAWEGQPTDRTLRFRLVPSTPDSRPAQVERPAAGQLEPGDEEPVHHGAPAAKAAPPSQRPAASDARPQQLQIPALAGTASPGAPEPAPTRSAGTPEARMAEALGAAARGSAGDAVEPTTVSPEGEVVPLFGPRRGRPPKWLLDARNAYLEQQARQ
jgi:hypothetical protein